MSGLQADARSMIEHARVECQSHAFNYNEPLGVESTTQAICDLALRFGEGAEGEETIMSRPFGVALLVAGYDENGPQLFHAEPSGTFYRYDAKAIGSGSEGAQAELQNEYHKVRHILPPPPSLRVSVQLLLRVLACLLVCHTTDANDSPRLVANHC